MFGDMDVIEKFSPLLSFHQKPWMLFLKPLKET